MSLLNFRRYENRLLRKWDETGEWTKMHCEELKNLYSSPNIIIVIKQRRMRWARLVERMRIGDFNLDT
jgi:hypothetical protein